MNLQKIEAYIQYFKTYLKSKAAVEELYKWESQKVFQDNWNIEDPNLLEVYDRSLKNSQTSRLWKDGTYRPKEVMLILGELSPEYLGHIFGDLFNEEKNVADRLDRFIFYCNDLLNEYKIQYPLKIENNHYHDYFILSLYLSFHYPEQYTFYNFDTFKQSLIHLGSRNIPELNDIERFFKISRTLWKFLEKDEEVWKLHQKRLYSDIFYKEKSLLLVHEFFKVIASKKL